MNDLVAATEEDTQIDLFVADLVDVPVKGEMTTMEFPLFSLAKRKDTEIFRYESADGKAWIEVIPSVMGRATIFDKDLLIYCFSQLREAMNRGQKVGRRVRITVYDFLISSGRGTGGREYKLLQESLTRIKGTTFKTNLSTLKEGEEVDAGRLFGLVDDIQTVSHKSRLQAIEIVIGEGIFSAINNKNVLTYNRDYFNLTSPIDRRIYELCRKHCGTQKEFGMYLDNWHSKSGSRSQLKEFTRMVKTCVERQPIPDYFLKFEAGKGRGARSKLIAYYDSDSSLKNAVKAEAEEA